ncbi:hypothetical protein ACCS96_21005, partial [Rhizobium ruizarguesonis]
MPKSVSGFRTTSCSNSLFENRIQILGRASPTSSCSSAIHAGGKAQVHENIPFSAMVENLAGIEDVVR